MFETDADTAPTAWTPRCFRSRREFAAFLVTLGATLAVYQSLVPIERIGVMTYLVLIILCGVAVSSGWKLWQWRRSARH